VVTALTVNVSPAPSLPSLTATHHPLTSMPTHPSPDFGPIIKAWGGLRSHFLMSVHAFCTYFIRPARECYAADSNEELFKWFTARVQRNLHIVFTMNPASADFGNRAATSPALFNRCVVNWMGDWSNRALAQVGHEFTTHVDMEDLEYRAPSDIEARTMLRTGVLPARKPAGMVCPTGVVGCGVRRPRVVLKAENFGWVLCLCCPHTHRCWG
jgi:hypothetical protein